MIDKPEYYPIGNLRKPFGYSGLMQFSIDDAEIEDRFYDLQHIYLKVDGQFLPFFIKEFTEKGDVYLCLEEVEDLQQALKLSGSTIFITKDQIPENLLTKLENLSPMEGYLVYNDEIEIGNILSLTQMPTQVLAHIQYKNGEISIPLVAQFIGHIDHKCKKIYMKFPEELLSL